MLLRAILLIVSVSFCAVPSVVHAQDQTGMVLVENGKSLAPIILPAEPTMFTKIAAADLADYIGKVSGAKPEILEGLPNPVPEQAIWVGFQPQLKVLFPGTDFDFKHPEEILIKCDGKHLAIVGRGVWDPLTNKKKIVAGQTEDERKDYRAGFAEANRDVEGFQFEYGTVNAVATFLQDQLGVRMLGRAGGCIRRQRLVSHVYPLPAHRAATSRRARDLCFAFMGQTDFTEAAHLQPRDPAVLARCISPADLGQLLVQTAQLPAHLVAEEIKLWPMVQPMAQL